jgi:hypothetical protein
MSDQVSQIDKIADWIMEQAGTALKPEQRPKVVQLLVRLTPFELDMVWEACDGSYRVADLLHDIRGIGDHDEYFLPRVIGRNRKEATDGTE